jgi:hypothetical protein
MLLLQFCKELILDSIEVIYIVMVFILIADIIFLQSELVLGKLQS